MRHSCENMKVGFRVGEEKTSIVEVFEQVGEGLVWGGPEPCHLAAVLGASIPSSEALSIEQHGAKRMVPHTALQAAGSLQVGFMSCSPVAGI